MIKGFDAPISVPVILPPVQPAGGVLLSAKDRLFPEKAGATVIVLLWPKGGTLDTVVLPGTVVVTVPLVQVMLESDVVTSKPGDAKVTG